MLHAAKQLEHKLLLRLRRTVKLTRLRSVSRLQLRCCFELHVLMLTVTVSVSMLTFAVSANMFIKFSTYSKFDLIMKLEEKVHPEWAGLLLLQDCACVFQMRNN